MDTTAQQKGLVYRHETRTEVSINTDFLISVNVTPIFPHPITSQNKNGNPRQPEIYAGDYCRAE